MFKWLNTQRITDYENADKVHKIHRKGSRDTLLFKTQAKGLLHESDSSDSRRLIYATRFKDGMWGKVFISSNRPGFVTEVHYSDDARKSDALEFELKLTRMFKRYLETRVHDDPSDREAAKNRRHKR